MGVEETIQNVLFCQFPFHRVWWVMINWPVIICDDQLVSGQMWWVMYIVDFFWTVFITREEKALESESLLRGRTRVTMVNWWCGQNTNTVTGVSDMIGRGLIKYFGNCNGQPYSGFPTHTCKRNLTRSTLEKPVHLTIKVHLKIHLASNHIFWVEIHLFLFQFFPKTVSIDCVGRDLSPIELYPVFSHLATNWALSSLFNSPEIFQWTRCHFSDNWAAGSSNHWHLSIQAFFLFFFKSITKLKNWFERTSKEVTRPADFS